MKINVKSDCRGMDVHEVVDQIFKDRGIEDPEHFMNPTIDDMLPLDAMTNSVEAAQKVINAVYNDYKIGILFDVDADGLTSGTIIYRYLKHMGAEPVPFINHGKQHGLQKDNLDRYRQLDFLIIVDSLDSNAYLYADLKDNSEIEDIIVLDHHAINPSIPYDDYVTLVSSQRDYDNPDLSGAGVCWKFVKLMDEILDDDYADELTDLAVSGIIADVSDMTSMENRYIASLGLETIHNPAIAKVAGGFGWDSKAVTFSLAPIANATNRVDKNEDAMKAFIEDDNKEVLKYVKSMKQCKDLQNEEIARLMPDVEKQCDEQLNNKMIVVFIESEYGIAGLLATRLVSKYHRPILVLQDRDEKWSGSMRSVGTDDFREMLNESGMARSFGHPNAASCEVDKRLLEDLINYMDRHLPDVDAFEETIDADIWVNLEDITEEFINGIKELNYISGEGFKPIKVYLDGIIDYEIADMSQGKHLVIRLGDSILTLIKWNFSGDWDELRDYELMGEELQCVVELQSGYIGRAFLYQGIMDYVGVKDE